MSKYTRIILYKHGVGYFERSAEVDGDTSLEIEFKRGEMNDILKSLTIQDAGGGKIAGISYESPAPVSEQLREIALSIPDSQVLSGLLKQLKGIRVRLRVAGQEHVGSILGAQTFQTKAGEESHEEIRIFLWTEDGEMQNFNALSIQSFAILDDRTQRDVKKLLETVQYWKEKQTHRMLIETRGSGKRRINMSYIVETPVWKTSYRIVLGAERSLIQGWALIDNSSQDDWEDVQISLVAGLPISFIHDLHSPRYRVRPTLEISEASEYGAPVLEAPIARRLAEEVAYAREALSRSIATQKAAGSGALAQEEIDTLLGSTELLGESSRDDVDYNFDIGDPSPSFSLANRVSDAEASSRRQTEQADLYVYEVKTPVNVKQGQSALVPILAEAFDGRRAAIYNPSIRRDNPLTAVLFRNSTGLTLESGPITVYSDEEYLGEGTLNMLKPGEETLIPFAVELNCRIEQDHRSETREVYRCEIRNGILTAVRLEVRSTRYNIDNTRNSHAIELYIDHAFLRGGRVAGETQPELQTENFHRYKVHVAAETAHFLEIIEHGDRATATSLLQLSEDRIERYLATNLLSKTVAENLRKLVAVKERIAALSEDIKKVKADVEGVFKNQERLRENLKALGSGPGETELRERYLKQLARDEDILAGADARLAALESERRQAQQERNTLLKLVSNDSVLE